ncbi:MAG: ABC transporter ATP-binding protein [Alphaproteobacteria bacterium]
MNPAAEPALAVDGLGVRFGGAVAVDGVSLTLAGGAVTALIGESGSGKSATLLAIAGLLPATAVVSGAVRLQGRSLLDMAETERERTRGAGIGMVFQDPAGSLNPVLSVGNQVDEVLAVHRGLRGRAARRETERLLAQVGIGDASRRARAYPHQLSGGMKQRVAIAAALAAGPAVILADEPTTALDATVQAQVLDLLRGLVAKEGVALLLVTHDLAVAAAVADRVAVIYAGRIVEERTTAALVERPAHPYSRALAEAALPFVAQGAAGRGRLPELPGRMAPAGGTGCAFAPRCALALDRCRAEAPRLEDVEDGLVACWRAGEAER